jgi:hypothetical protein
MKSLYRFSILLFSAFNSFNSSAQSFDNENEYLKQSNDRVISIDQKFHLLSDTVYDGNSKIIGYYDYKISKFKEINKNYFRLYYFWRDSLFMVFDSNQKKKIFLDDEYYKKDIKLSEYFNSKANHYKSMFDSIIIKTEIPIQFRIKDVFNDLTYIYVFDQDNFNIIECLIKETDRYFLKEYYFTISFAGFCESFKVSGCNITKSIKLNMNYINWKCFESILIYDKKRKLEYLLPNIIIKSN